MNHRTSKRTDMIKYVIAAVVLLFAITGSNRVSGSAEPFTETPCVAVKTLKGPEPGRIALSNDKTQRVDYCQLRLMPMQLIR